MKDYERLTPIVYQEWAEKSKPAGTLTLPSLAFHGGHNIALVFGDRRLQRNPDFNRKPTLRRVGCAHRASMEPECLLSNREAEANASGGSATGVINAVKRTEDFAQFALRNTGTGVGDAYDRLAGRSRG